MRRNAVWRALGLCNDDALRRATTLFLALAAASLVVFFTVREASGQQPGGEVDEDPSGAPYVAGELIVTYRQDLEEREDPTEPPSRSFAASAEATVEETVPELDSQLLSFPEVKEEPSRQERENSLEATKQELEEDPSIESADYNYLREFHAATNDPRFGQQWNLRKIAAPAAWNREVGNENTRIAIIDSGIDLNHPDLQDKIRETCNTTSASNGSAPCSGNADDTDSHGTHVAGIAAAQTNNNRGVAGVCRECSLMAAKVENDDGGITGFAVISALAWAAENDADVINMSFGGEGQIPAERNAVARARDREIVVVASAGNDGTNARTYPAAYPGVISVAATTKQDTRASYSNFGNWIDVTAPGGDATRSGGVISTLPGGYGVKSGTSMSSPVVAGIAGLMASQGLGRAEIEKKIKLTATDLGPRGKDARFGFGRVDAAAAVGARPRNTAPLINRPFPKPGARVKTRTVTIRATVQDRQSNLRRADIRLIVDGRRVGFKYNAANDRLTKKMRLGPGRHRIAITARDGWGLNATKRWAFTVSNQRPNPNRNVRSARAAPGSPPDETILDRLYTLPPFTPAGWPLSLLR